MNQEKAIVFLSNHMHFGGSQKIIYNILDGISKFYNNVYLISKSGHYSNLLVKNKKVIFIDSTNLGVLKIRKKIKHLQKKHNKIILHTNNREHIIQKLFLSKKNVHIHTFHSAYPDKNYIYKFLKPQHSISISLTVLKYLEKYNIKSKLIYNGVSVENIIYENIEKEKFKILFVGRLSKEKGIFQFLKAITSIKKTNLQFDIIGDGILLEKSQQFVKKNNINVSFKGFKENPWKNISEYNLLVIPSFYEGFCLVGVEGGSIGIPIIGSNILALKEVLAHLQEDCFFNINQLDSIKQTLLFAIENINQLKENALKNKNKIKDKFSIEKMIEKYYKLYNNFE